MSKQMSNSMKAFSVAVFSGLLLLTPTFSHAGNPDDCDYSTVAEIKACMLKSINKDRLKLGKEIIMLDQEGARLDQVIESANNDITALELESTVIRKRIEEIDTILGPHN